MRRLASGSPETMTGPESPPLSNASGVSSRKPPFTFSAFSLWQRKQFSAKTGRTFVSKNSKSSAVELTAESRTVEAKTNRGTNNGYLTQSALSPHSHGHQ